MQILQRIFPLAGLPDSGPSVPDIRPLQISAPQRYPHFQMAERTRSGAGPAFVQEEGAVRKKRSEALSDLQRFVGSSGGILWRLSQAERGSQSRKLKQITELRRLKQSKPLFHKR